MMMFTIGENKPLGWLCLILLVCVFIWYQAKPRVANIYFADFILSQTFLWSEWFARFHSEFRWFDIVKDGNYGNHKFKELVIEVTGRKMSAFEIARTLKQVALEFGIIFIFFRVSIINNDDHDLVRIIYVIPPWYPDYKRAVMIAKQHARAKELKREKERRPMSGIKLK